MIFIANKFLLAFLCSTTVAVSTIAVTTSSSFPREQDENRRQLADVGRNNHQRLSRNIDREVGSSRPQPTISSIIALPSIAASNTPKLIDAGIFKHPPTYVQPNAQTFKASVLYGELLTNQESPRHLAVQVPYWSPRKRQIVLPTVNIDGIVYAQTGLYREIDGTFSVTFTPWIQQGQPISAANYKNGTLTLTSLIVGSTRYSNVKLQLNASGKFELTDAFIPITVARSSYDNYQNVTYGPQKLPIVRGPYVYEQFSGGRAFGDFTQTGEYSYFSMAIQWWNSSNRKEPAVFAFFTRKNGEWVDITHQLVDKINGIYPTVCAGPRQGIVNDFNGDRIPDIFVACHGTEHESISHNDRGEDSYFMMSRLDGKYDVVPFSSHVKFAHGATAYDFSGNGFADLLVADMDYNNQWHKMPLAYFKNSNGKFEWDQQRLAFLSMKTIFSTDILTINGRLYLYVSGPDVEFYGNIHGRNAMFFEIQDGQFSTSPEFIIPSLEQQEIKQCFDCFNLSLMLTVHNEKVYVIKVTPLYTNYAIVEYNTLTRTTRYVHKHDGSMMRQWSPGLPERPECDGIGTTWIDFIRVHNNRIIHDSACTSPNVQMN